MKTGWLAAQLPTAMAEDDFLQRFVGIFEEVADSTLEVADSLEHQFDAGLAPLPMVRYMARWLGTQLPPDVPDDRQRMLLRAIGPNIEWRGTKRGLKALLEAFTDAEVEIQDSGGVYPGDERPTRDDAHITVSISESGLLTKQELLQMIRDEIPAGAKVDLIVGSEEVGEEAEAPLIGQEMIEEAGFAEGQPGQSEEE